MPKSPVSVMVSIVGSATRGDATTAEPVSIKPDNSDDWLAEKIAKIAKAGIESLLTGNLLSTQGAHARARKLVLAQFHGAPYSGPGGSKLQSRRSALWRTPSGHPGSMKIR
jgi:hypothetical protein